MNPLATALSSEFVRGELPCPKPLSAAIEAGMFGTDENGAFVPDADDVRSITAEHARELSCLLLELAYLQRCSRYKINPLSGKTLRSGAKREQLSERLARETEKLRQQFQDARAAYAEAFGEEGANALERFVRENLPEAQAEPHSRLQREMF